MLSRTTIFFIPFLNKHRKPTLIMKDARKQKGYRTNLADKIALDMLNPVELVYAS
jgi:hypothetical protein